MTGNLLDWVYLASTRRIITTGGDVIPESRMSMMKCIYHHHLIEGCTIKRILDGNETSCVRPVKLEDAYPEIKPKTVISIIISV